RGENPDFILLVHGSLPDCVAQAGSPAGSRERLFFVAFFYYLYFKRRKSRLYSVGPRFPARLRRAVGEPVRGHESTLTCRSRCFFVAVILEMVVTNSAVDRHYS